MPGVKGQGCADVAEACGVDTAGTAPAIRSWLLIEHAGPWPEAVREHVLTAALPADRRALLAQLWKTEGLRPLLIRRPGRVGRRDAGPPTVLVGASGGGRRWLERVPAADARDLARDLARLDLEALAAGEGGHGEPVDGPLFLVCAQGSVDGCCAVRGRPVVAALAGAHPQRTWEVTHLGGCRFAPNLLVLPDAVMHGHLDPAAARAVADAALSGRVVPGHLRGRTGASRWAGGAEVAVRRMLGAVPLDKVVAVAPHEHPDTAPGQPGTDGPSPEGADVVVRAAGNSYGVRLRTEARPGVASRCGPDGTGTSTLVATSLRPLPHGRRPEPAEGAPR